MNSELFKTYNTGTPEKKKMRACCQLHRAAFLSSCVKLLVSTEPQWLFILRVLASLYTEMEGLGEINGGLREDEMYSEARRGASERHVIRVLWCPESL